MHTKKVRPAEAPLRYTYQFLMCDVDDSSRVSISLARRAPVCRARVDVYPPFQLRRPRVSARVCARVAPPAWETAPDQNTWLTQAMTRVLESRESVPALALAHLSGRCQALVQGTCRLHPLRTRLPAVEDCPAAVEDRQPLA